MLREAAERIRRHLGVHLVQLRIEENRVIVNVFIAERLKPGELEETIIAAKDSSLIYLTAYANLNLKLVKEESECSQEGCLIKLVFKIVS
ncbi:hypothetical protein IPA_01510 [Ignicoccus pacificus DSM 13166]|uniref:Uncharacterized protein n=1 Tax=Ignicoccus pacificus DSM 13166 TaxID=940294 RepID=A0A977KCG4_9CREN|nr:hypothetical protein IPA_01510 [Ignicoccus pacificus DSM 13166]